MAHSIESIRLRPGMYVGDLHDGSGRLQLLWELVANAFDQCLAGACDEIGVMIDAEGAFVVEDNGRGMRVDLVDGVPFAQLALTRHHDAPTLDGHAPHEHLGTRGVGLFPVCALAQRLDLDVFRDGRHYAQCFERGLPCGPLRDVGASDRRGTRIRVLPDPSIFGATPIETDAIAAKLHAMSCLFPTLRFRFADRRERLFHAPEGLQTLVDDMLRRDGARAIGEAFSCNARIDDLRVEVAAVWCDRGDRRIESYANVSRTTGGGTHENGLLRGLAQGARSLGTLPVAGLRVREVERAIGQGLRAVVCVRLTDPTYARPTRERLISPGVSDLVARCVAPCFAQWLAGERAISAHLAARFG